MKIFTNNAAYIQVYDLVALNRMSDRPIPVSIYKIIDKYNDNNIINLMAVKYSFIKFEDKYAINYIKTADWIANYDDLKDLSIDDINEKRKITLEKICNIRTRKKLYKEDSKERYDLDIEFQRLNYESHNLNDMKKLKKGKIKIELPQGVEYPEECAHLYENNSHSSLDASKFFNYIDNYVNSDQFNSLYVERIKDKIHYGKYEKGTKKEEDVIPVTYENLFPALYSFLVYRYENIMEVGWCYGIVNDYVLIPTFGDKLVIEFDSDNENDKSWMYDIISNYKSNNKTLKINI